MMAAVNTLARIRYNGGNESDVSQSNTFISSILPTTEALAG
jgi:hypothetical protein